MGLSDPDCAVLEKPCQTGRGCLSSVRVSTSRLAVDDPRHPMRSCQARTKGRGTDRLAACQAARRTTRMPSLLSDEMEERERGLSVEGWAAMDAGMEGATALGRVRDRDERACKGRVKAGEPDAIRCDGTKAKEQEESRGESEQRDGSGSSRAAASTSNGPSDRNIASRDGPPDSRGNKDARCTLHARRRDVAAFGRARHLLSKGIG